MNIFVYSQKDIEIVVEKEADTIIYQKNTHTSEERSFSSHLNEKYNGKDFKYTENEPEKKDRSASIHLDFIQGFVFFMSQIFPYLLGGIIIFIILKILFGFDFQFWKTNKLAKRKKVNLIYEDEDIHQADLEALLQQAIAANEFRLAIRYYYLLSLKGLSSKKIIDYHKDKTNSEYLFEIENTEIKNTFSYILYVYTYVWYGEFPIDERHFKAAQLKYQSFLNALL